jgi:hypothetical protein
MSNKIFIGISIVSVAVASYFGYKTIGLRKELLKYENPDKHIGCPALNYDYSKDPFEGIINYETAIGISENYKNDLYKSTINTGGKTLQNQDPDARSVWFSLDRLKNFIWHVEKANCDSGCNEASLGLRIYFAKYPDLNNTNYTGLKDVPKNYSNHHTLFMVPTYQNEKGYNVDFYPARGCRALFYKVPLNGIGEPLPESDITPFLFLMGTGEEAQNHGGLIPPGEETGTSFNK